MAHLARRSRDRTGPSTDGREQLGPSGVAVWNSPAIDAKRGQLYVATSDNYSLPGTDLSDAVLALDLETGRIRWHYQALAGDTWNVACVDQNQFKLPRRKRSRFRFRRGSHSGERQGWPRTGAGRAEIGLCLWPRSGHRPAGLEDPRRARQSGGRHPFRHGGGGGRAVRADHRQRLFRTGRSPRLARASMRSTSPAGNSCGRPPRPRAARPCSAASLAMAARSP